jgi:hypothetical protein
MELVKQRLLKPFYLKYSIAGSLSMQMKLQKVYHHFSLKKYRLKPAE